MWELLQLLPPVCGLRHFFVPFLPEISVVADGCDYILIDKAWWDPFCLEYDFPSSMQSSGLCS